MATPTTANERPQADTQKTLWANANETLIAPQLLLITEPNTTIITANTSATEAVADNQSNNNNDEEEESNLADLPQEPNASSIAEQNITPKNSTTLQAPKSPPRWPLRPGVMLHVSRDTKQNLAVNRMTLKPETISKKSSSNNTSIISETSGVIFTSSPLLAGTLGRPKEGALPLNFETAATLPLRSHSSNNNTAEQNMSFSQQNVSQNIIPVESTSNLVPEPSEPNSVQNTSGKFERRVQQFLVNLFRRAKGARSDSTRDSQRSHVGLLSGMIFGRRQPNDSQFDSQHRLKGIRCSGSVTYKKTHLLNKTNATTDTSATTIITTVAATTTTATLARPTTVSPSYNSPQHLRTNSLTLNNSKNSSYIINHIITQTAMTSSSQVPQQHQATLTAKPLLPPPPPPPPLPPPPTKCSVQRSASCGHSKQSPASVIYPVPCCNITTKTHSSLAATTIAPVVAVQSAPNTPRQLGMRIASTGSQSAGNTPMRSILKNRSPPPTAPPRSKAKTMNTIPAQLGVVQSKP